MYRNLEKKYYFLKFQRFSLTLLAKYCIFATWIKPLQTLCGFSLLIFYIMSLRPYFLSFISSLLLIGCSEKEKENTAVDYFLSKDPSVLFQIHQKDQFLSEVINNDFWKNYFKYYPNTNVQNLLRSLPKDSDIWIAYTHQGAYISTYLPEEDTSSPWKDTSLDQLDSLTIENKKMVLY